MQLTGIGLCIELNSVGVGRAVNRYRFVFGNEESRHGACIEQVSVCVWN